MDVAVWIAGPLAALAVLVWPRRDVAGDATTPDGGAVPGRGQGGPRAARPDLGERRRRPSQRAGLGAAARVAQDLVPRVRSALRSRSSTARDVAREVQLLDGLAAALEAGLPVPQAVEVALAPQGGAVDGPWAELHRAAVEGQPLGQAWQRVARRTRSPTAAAVARAWAVAAASGAPVAAAVRSSAQAARERRRLERAVETATAGARATATVLTVLPVAGVGLATLLGVPPQHLYGHPLAVASAALGVVLLAVGALVVRRMVASVLAAVT